MGTGPAAWHRQSSPKQTPNYPALTQLPALGTSSLLYHQTMSGVGAETHHNGEMVPRLSLAPRGLFLSADPQGS